MDVYYGYYRESNKYKTEWLLVAKSANRKIVSSKLKTMISKDRAERYYGSRIKIEKRS